MKEVAIGFLLPKEDLGRIVEFAREADRLGYELHCPEGGWSDPFTILGAVAQATHRVRLATHVTVVPYYHPWHLARKVVTLDHLSRGRFTLFAGVGWRPPEFENLGLPYTRRGKLADEALHVLKALLTEGDVEFAGRFFRIGGLVTRLERCVQRPHPPIVIGGGPRAMVDGRPQWPGTRLNDPDAALRRVVRFGDGWSAPSFNDVAHVAGGYRRILEHAAEAGRTMPERFVTVCTGSVNIDADDEAARRDVLAHDAPRTIRGGVYRSEGNPALEDRLGERYSGAVGTPERCVAMMRELLRVPGLERIVVHLHATDDLAQLERFHRYVRPHLALAASGAAA